jgi:hypothetical protein
MEYNLFFPRASSEELSQIVYGQETFSLLHKNYYKLLSLVQILAPIEMNWLI